MLKCKTLITPNGCHNCKFKYVHHFVSGGFELYCHFDESFIPTDEQVFAVEEYVYDDTRLAEYCCRDFLEGIEDLQSNVWRMFAKARRMWEDEHAVESWMICGNFKEEGK